MRIQVRGVETEALARTERRVREVLVALGIDAEVERVVDDRSPVTPVVVVDGIVRVEGRVPEGQEIQDWFTA